MVPDLAYSRLKLANICQSRDSRYGEYPEPNPQASNVAFTPVCRGLFTEHVETGAVRQWLEFGQAVTTALRTVVGWAEINMVRLINSSELTLDNGRGRALFGHVLMKSRAMKLFKATRPSSSGRKVYPCCVGRSDIAAVVQASMQLPRVCAPLIRLFLSE